MSDLADEIAKEFEQDIQDEHKPTPEETPEKTPETPESPEEPKKAEEEETNPEEETPDGESDDKPAEKKAQPATPSAEEEPEDTPKEEPKPLTEEGVLRLMNQAREEERNSTKEVEAAIDEVIEEYHPDGLSNVLVDERTGKELKTPQDVVEASDGEMSTEEAANWLLNKQHELNSKVNAIREEAKVLAENTLTFKRDMDTVLQKYEPLFKKYPHLQKETFDMYFENVQTTKDGKYIAKLPDMIKFYDFTLNPYRMAMELGTQQPATAATESPKEEKPAEPTAEDRMDITGDGGDSPVDDPNDFGQQVKKELAKGF